MTPSAPVIEIRAYKLKPGTGEQFNMLFIKESLPLLKKWGVTVLSYGNSLHDEDCYYLCRSYSNPEFRQQSQNAFYGSDDWVNGPRENILSLIDYYTTTVIPIDTFTKNFNVMSIDEKNTDKIKLSELNALYIKNFVTADVEAHNKLLHNDFVCIQSNGTIVGKSDYLKGLVTGYKDSGYTSFSIGEEDIKILGTIALVRSKTTYTKVENGTTMKGHSVYTDTYTKENDDWKCIQAQITPVK